MKRLPACLALLCAASLAYAQLRSLPPEARRGQIGHLQEMVVQIDGQAARLAAGAQVRDAHNRIVLPTAIPPGSLVKYTVNGQGEVSAVWILSEQEAAR